MKAYIKALLATLIFLNACGKSKDAPQPDPEVVLMPEPAPEIIKKNILIIGDSMSYAYWPWVQQDLKEIANVDHNKDNAQNTRWTIEHLDEWLAVRESFDLITWNNGAWDCNFASYDGALFTSPEEYEANLRIIAPKLLAKAKKVLYFGTVEIPVNEGGRTDACALERNLIAKHVAHDFGIEFYDMHPISASIPELRINPEAQDNIHVTEAGGRVLANFATQSILEVLGL